MSFASVLANDKHKSECFFFLIIMLKSFYVEPSIKRKNKMILSSNSLIWMILLIGNIYNPT